MRKISITADEFAERVSKATNGRISIVKESYTGTRHKVTAYCNVHKIYFEVKYAYKLENGAINCPECSKEQIQKRNEEKIIPFSEMLLRFKEAYGEKFSYDASSYCGRKKLMKVHCNDCGEDFEITPEHHLKYNNGGCPNCHKTKIVKCSKCGKDIIVDRRSPINAKYICNECYNKSKEKKKIIKKCKICGRELINGKCQNQFCNEHYKSKIFKILIDYFGFDETKLGTINAEKEFERIRNILYDMYWKQHMSSTEICNFFNYPKTSDLTRTVFKNLKIISKTRKQAAKENIEMNRLTLNKFSKFEKFKHICWNNTIVFLRSSYEEDYANYLDANKVLYNVENLKIFYFDTQKQEKRIAIPDFYLSETNTIVEIESNWTLDVINMIDKVKAYKENG